MDLLPDEMLLQILSYISPQELLYCTSRVCRRWERLALNVSIWVTSNGFCYHTPGALTLNKASPPAPVLKTLVLHAQDDVVALLNEWFGRCEVVRRLDLISCRLGKEAGSDRLLGLINEHFPELQALSLENSGESQAELDYKVLAGFRHLTALNLSRCKAIPSHVLSQIADNCSLLQELRLDWGTEFYDQDVIHVINRLHHQLKLLTLGGEMLTDATYVQLCKCEKLAELGLAPSGMLTDQGLLEGIAPLRQVRVLQLTDANSVTSVGLVSFFNLFPADQLTKLVIAWCSALDDDILELTAHRCKNLKHLSIRNSQQVTDRGIASIVQNCDQLESLSLVWNDQLRGTRFLPLIASHLPKLRYLDLGYCDNIMKETIDQLMRQRRTIKVVRPEVWCRPRKVGHNCCGRWDSSNY
ncbi:F-box/LRR-repeat protein fbxl-1 [Anabrus simplex]|uniref:F-box/LRR-repeat protein fbxl-1 n=1 Tax=Anabrus simplex TaxID=316456 RepID=UPI0035A35C96